MNAQAPNTEDEDRKIWDALLATPESDAYLERLIQAAMLELGDELGDSQESQPSEAQVAQPKGGQSSGTFGS